MLTVDVSLMKWHNPTNGDTPMAETPSESRAYSAHVQSLWLADIVTIGLLIGFVAMIYIWEQLLEPRFDDSALLLAGTILALVPALLWLWFFYRRDAAEPEPRAMVLGVFALGALLAASVGNALLNSVFHVTDWMYANQPWSYIAAAVLVIGFTQQFLIYAAVRWSVFGSAEFDGPTDGIIYATAAGLGYATILNIRFIINDGAASLTLAAIQIVMSALALASFAGIVGYFLGREKHEERPVWWMAAGLVLAAVLNGVFLFLRGQLTGGSTVGGAPANNWLSLIIAAILAIGTALILSRLIREDVEEDLLEEAAAFDAALAEDAVREAAEVQEDA
jgi:RsiW-degrading membrane proteinase PrsW (M82 family)